jgi:hypothetical protein
MLTHILITNHHQLPLPNAHTHSHLKSPFNYHFQMLTHILITNHHSTTTSKRSHTFSSQITIKLTLPNAHTHYHHKSPFNYHFQTLTHILITNHHSTTTSKCSHTFSSQITIQLSLPNAHTPSHHKSAISFCHLATVSCNVNCFVVAMRRKDGPAVLFVWLRKKRQQFTTLLTSYMKYIKMK